MSRPRLLDLFCGAGGAAMGYHRAGFDVVGVDIKPQKHYPFEFHQGDALEYVAAHGHEYDVIHASPPCQGYSEETPLEYRGNHPRMIGAVRDALQKIGKPYIIENVDGARTWITRLCCAGRCLASRYGDIDGLRHQIFLCLRRHATTTLSQC